MGASREDVFAFLRECLASERRDIRELRRLFRDRPFQYLPYEDDALFSGNRGAYRYLPESVAHFPAEAELADRMRRAGFRDVKWDSLTLGVAAIHVGIRA